MRLRCVVDAFSMRLRCVLDASSMRRSGTPALNNPPPIFSPASTFLWHRANTWTIPTPETWIPIIPWPIQTTSTKDAIQIPANNNKAMSSTIHSIHSLRPQQQPSNPNPLPPALEPSKANPPEQDNDRPPPRPKKRKKKKKKRDCRPSATTLLYGESKQFQFESVYIMAPPDPTIWAT